MMNINKIQDFFNTNPVVAGILVFVIISLLVVIIWLVVFFGSKYFKNIEKKEKDKTRYVYKKEKIKTKKPHYQKIKKEKRKFKLNWSWKWNWKRKKTKPLFNQKNQEIETEKTFNNEEQIKSIPLNDIIVDFNKDGKLILKNLTKKEIINKPSKKDYYDIMMSKSFRLLLPEDYVEIEIDNDNISNILKTSKPVKDRNLYVFNSLKKFLNENDILWALSKFN